MGHAVLFAVVLLASVPARADDAALMREAGNALAQKNYPLAFSRFSALARRGDALAQFNVGAFYYDGLGVPRDERQAFDWFAKSAAQGSARALQVLKDAASRGNPYAIQAQNALRQPASPPRQAAVSAENDQALMAQANAALAGKDYATAFSGFETLARRGNAIAQFNVGAFYYNGWGVQRDQAQAFDWFGKSAAQGNARARQVIQDAAARGNPYAQNAAAGLDRPAAPRAGSVARNDQAEATDPRPPGFTLGVTVGQTQKLAGIRNSSAYGLAAGYRFDDNWSLELTYSALYRRADASTFISAVYPGLTATFDLTAISVTGQYAHRLGGPWTVLGELGAHHSSFKVNGTGGTLMTGTSSGLVAGMKLQIDAGSDVAIRAGFDTYTQSGGISGTLTEAGVGVVYRF